MIYKKYINNIYIKELKPKNDMNPVSWTQEARFLYVKINL